MPLFFVFRRESLTLAVLSAALVAAAPPVRSAADPLVEIQDLYKSGRTGDAMRRLDTLITQRPADPRLRFQKGVMLVEQKRPNEAIAVFQKLVQDYPALPEPLNNLAVLYAEQGQMEKARTTLESAIRSKPNYGTAFQNLGDLYTRMAGRAYARALQIDDAEGAPKLALIRNLYEAPEVSGSDTLLVAAAGAAAASAVPAPRPSPGDGTNSASKAPARPPAVSPAPAEVKSTAPARPAPSPPAAAHGDEVREVTSALKAWADAWSRRDVADYVAAYVPGFKGGERNSDEWQTARRQRILGKSQIDVEVSNVKVNFVADGAAKVTFRQTYVADQLKVGSTKTLEMVKQRGKWLIRRESVGAG